VYSRHTILGRAVPLAIAIFFCSVQFLAATNGAAAPGHPAGREAGDPAGAEPLAIGQTVDRELAVGEVHTFVVNLAADQAANLQLKTQGVAAIVELFSPGGGSLGTFGSMAISRGTDRIRFLSVGGGAYRMTVRTFLKPSPPGHYQLTLVGVDAASEQDKRSQASQSCQESDWLDRDGNFLVNDALESIFGCLSAVAIRLESEFPKVTELTAVAGTEVSYLKDSWHWGEFVSPAYQESLVQTFAVLALAAREPDGHQAYSILDAVVEDLKIKANHCRKSNRGLGGDITVKVKTLRNTRDDPGWVIYYTLGIFEYAKNHRPDRFMELSSPSIGTLPAGRYLLWARKPGLPENAPARKELFRIGDGAKELTLDLLVQ
jgi:hypothetical protein